MFCPNCGTKVDSGAFCPNCGTPLAQQTQQTQQTPPPQDAPYQAPQPNGSVPYQMPAIPPELLETKGIAVAIVLSIVTCGIYGLFWYYNIVKRIHYIYAGNFDCVAEYLLLLFVPFYGWYWLYTRSQRLAQSSVRYGVALQDQSLANLLLAIFGLGIVSFALLQDQLNQIARALGGQ